MYFSSHAQIFIWFIHVPSKKSVASFGIADGFILLMKCLLLYAVSPIDRFIGLMLSSWIISCASPPMFIAPAYNQTVYVYNQPDSSTFM